MTIKRIMLFVLAGWAAIMALGWWLAHARIAACPAAYNCEVHEMGTRDAFLIAGLLVPFLITVLGLVASLRSQRRRHGLPSMPALSARASIRPPSPSGAPNQHRGKGAICSVAVLMFFAGWFGAQLYAATAQNDPSPAAAVDQAEAAAIDAAAAATDAAAAEAYRAASPVSADNYSSFSDPVVAATDHDATADDGGTPDGSE